jgi:LPS export ABC transporter protein LptC
MMLPRPSAAAALALTMLVAATGCEEKIKPSVLSSVDSKTIPQQESWDSDIVVSDSGHVRAIIHAGYIRVFETNRQTEMNDGVRVRFFDRDGKMTTILTSKEGTVDEGTNNLQARKDVYVVSATDSSRMWTEILNWDNARQQIYTDEFVRIASPREELQGKGFESDQSLKNYRVFQVTGQTKPQ